MISETADMSSKIPMASQIVERRASMKTKVKTCTPTLKLFTMYTRVAAFRENPIVPIMIKRMKYPSIILAWYSGKLKILV